MVLPLSRHIPLVVLTIALVGTASFGAFAQAGVQDAPLHRNEATSSVGPYKPNDVLASLAEPLWITDGALDLTFHYKCITGYSSTTGAPQLDPNCDVGEDAETFSCRSVDVRYNLTGAQPSDSDPTIDPPLRQPDQLPQNSGTCDRTTVKTAYNDETFTGEIPATVLQQVPEGGTLGFVVDVPLANADAQCDGSSGSATLCTDPQHSTKEAFYAVRVDDSVPQIVLSDPSNANSAMLSETEWFLYSNTAMSNRLPSITVSVIDNLTGSPIDVDSVRLFRAGSDNTTNFLREKVTDWGYAYFYSYPTTGARSFEENTATRIDVFVNDTAGHTLDTRGRTNPAVWVVMDNSTPVLTVEDSGDPAAGGSHMKRHPGSTGLAALGEPMRVFVNATDVAGRKADNSLLNSPKEVLTVTMRFKGGPDNQTFSDPITIPYNQTRGYFYSANASIPQDWVNGVTYAVVTVSDPAENSVTETIIGSVNVDVEAPQIVPESPIGTQVSTDFTDQSQVTFRSRITDPGDDDDWNGADTEDTDFFGVDLDEVRVRYKIGENGVLRSGKMNALEADQTFQWINTFGSEDAVYYFIEAKDLAGNIATYPAAGDPSVLLNTTQNDGRFLFLQIDQRGPDIAPAKDLAYLGQGPHELSFTVVDGGVGVDASTVSLFWRPGSSGNFQEVPLSQDPQNATVFAGNIPTQSDGDQVQFYVAAADLLGNAGTYGSVGSPRTATIDLTAPSVTVNAPATTTQSTFNVTWSATDSGSGVKDFTLQFRIAPGGNWFTVPTRTETTLNFYELCAATGKTYEFRVSARDRAGNERAFPETADASTVVDAATSCAQAPEVTVSNPRAGNTLAGDVPITYSAVSTTAPGDLSVRLEVGTGTAFQTIVRDLPDGGTYTWASASHDIEVLCVPDGQYTIRAIASDPNGLEGSATVGPVTLNNGIVDCDDRDADGLPDAWETAQFGSLEAQPDDDDDNDGFNNLEEFRAGTDPRDAGSTPADANGGGNGLVDLAGWNNLYILVILGFVAVLAVFVIGMTRRW